METYVCADCQRVMPEPSIDGLCFDCWEIRYCKEPVVPHFEPLFSQIELEHI